MGKKAILFIVVGLILGAGLASGGIYFMIQNGAIKTEEPKEEVIDLTAAKRLTLENILIQLASTSSKPSYLKTTITVVFKDEEALAASEGIVPDIKEAICRVFETKTIEELKIQPAIDGGEVISPREAMKEPVLNEIKKLYPTEEAKEKVISVVIEPFQF